MGEDFDDDISRVLEEVLEGAVAKMTPEQLAELPNRPVLNEALSAAVNDAIERWADTTVSSLKKAAPGMIEHRRVTREQFEAQLAEHWGRAFDLAEMVIKVAHEIGEFFYSKHVPPDGQRDFVFEVLGRLQARGLRVAEEVLVLLKAGYGQAGMARWRALNEIAVVADFILTNGADTAERYFAHEAVETWKAMIEYQQHADALGETKYTTSSSSSSRRSRTHTTSSRRTAP